MSVIGPLDGSGSLGVDSDLEPLEQPVLPVAFTSSTLGENAASDRAARVELGAIERALADTLYQRLEPVELALRHALQHSQHAAVVRQHVRSAIAGIEHSMSELDKASMTLVGRDTHAQDDQQQDLAGHRSALFMLLRDLSDSTIALAYGLLHQQHTSDDLVAVARDCSAISHALRQFGVLQLGELTGDGAARDGAAGGGTDGRH